MQRKTRYQTSPNDSASGTLAMPGETSASASGTSGSRPRLSGTNLERAADHNQRITLHAIRISGSLTRVDLARITGLTAPAIANITRRLLDDGLIEDAGRRRGARGQPPTKLVLRHDACYAIGVNVDRDHITIVLVDFSGETLARTSEEVDFALPEQVRSLYRRSIRTMLKTARVDKTKIVGIGVAVPDDLGSIDLPGRPSAYAAWDSVDISRLFDQPFDLPVFVENDAAAAAMGEMQLGFGQTVNSFFYILISLGLGGGLVVDGAYVRGANGRSGELGYMRAPGRQKPGKQIQALVSLAGLSQHLKAHGFALADVMTSEAPEDSLETCTSDWVEQASRQLRDPLVAVNCLINPAMILVGGRLPRRLIEQIVERTNALLLEMIDEMPRLAPLARAALSEDAPAVGAAILPFSHFLLPKPSALWKVASKDTAIERND
jgi:predicted NBD/HSP70 family sugar kinase